MDNFLELCQSFGLPLWIAPLLQAAKRPKSDRARRKKAYKLIQKTLMRHNVGLTGSHTFQPTYVYPDEVKLLIRCIFPEDISDYPNPCHEQVVNVTIEDLKKIECTTLA